MTLILIVSLILSSSSVDKKSETCNATIFGYPGDKWKGGDSPYWHRPILPTDIGVAHRTLPLGSKVRVTNVRNGRSTVARVVDRGPFGRRNVRGRWYNGVEVFRRARRRRRPIPTVMASKGVDGWRGCLDLLPIVAKRIGLNGFEKVIVTPL